MASSPDDPHALATAFLDALRPVAARTASERTLSTGKVNVLRHLATYGRATTAALAGVLGVSAQAVSLAAKELEAAGFVERRPDADDRRRAWLVLTDAGERRLAEELELSARWLAEAIAARLSADEAAALARVVPVLHRLTAAEAGE